MPEHALDDQHPLDEAQATSAETSTESLQRYMLRIDRQRSLLLGLASQLPIMAVAAYLLPVLSNGLNRFIPRPTWPVAVLMVIIITFVPSVSVLASGIAIPMLRRGSVLLRSLTLLVLIASMLLGFLLGILSIGERPDDLFETEVLTVLIGLCSGAAVSGVVLQMGFGWTLCERHTDRQSLLPPKIRDLLEVTLLAGLCFAIFRALFTTAEGLFMLLIAILVGSVIGILGWLRLLALSPRKPVQKFGWIASALLACVGWYGLGLTAIYSAFGISLTNGLLLLLPAATGTALYMLCTALPLLVLKQHRWQLYRRGHADETASPLHAPEMSDSSRIGHTPPSVIDRTLTQ